MSRIDAVTPASGTVNSHSRHGESLSFLVVDDDTTNRLVLTAMLDQAGHRSIQAANGAEALEAFAYEHPDVVLLDIMMPVLDGYETARRIKALAGSRFVPIIFLTALTDERSLARCIEAGGDDFLTKPFNRIILNARIDALLRTRRLYVELERQHDTVRASHEHLQQERVLAERVFQSIVNQGCLNAPNLRSQTSPAALFNGDLLLVARRPDGGLLAMLGDFAGHGLPAAIGAMPVSEIFYTMAARGYSVREIAGEMNRKLRTVLPAGLFLAACFTEIDGPGRLLSVWNGGVPDLIVRSRLGRLRTLTSRHMPLGILPDDRFDAAMETVEIEAGDRIYLYTDGATEARNPRGEMFGAERLATALATSDDPFAALCAQLAAHRGAADQADDITLLEIVPQPMPPVTLRSDHPRAPSSWSVSVELRADALRTADPLPACLQMTIDLQGLHAHRERIYLILAELFNNALEHGLLGLDSAAKQTPHGFAEYYAARERGLEALDTGWIRITLQHSAGENGGRLAIHVEDSGPGFGGTLPATGATVPSGRGLALLKSLCRDVRLHGNGNHVEAVYEWQTDRVGPDATGAHA